MSSEEVKKKIFQVSYKIDDILTTFVFVFYNDVIFILISQLDKIGTLVLFLHLSLFLLKGILMNLFII